MLRYRSIRGIVLTLPVLLVMLSLAWQFDAAQKLRDRRERNQTEELHVWISTQDTDGLRFSDRVASMLKEDIQHRDNSDTTEEGIFIFSTGEIDSLMLLPANSGVFERVAGLLDVSVNAYPDWSGDEKVLAISTSDARELEVLRFLHK